MIDDNLADTQRSETMPDAVQQMHAPALDRMSNETLILELKRRGYKVYPEKRVRIPISAAAHIAKTYGYDQVIIYARKVGNAPNPHGEHMTTYGVDKANCDAAATIGDFLKDEIMGWVKP
jgi:hypothetical protein